MYGAAGLQTMSDVALAFLALAGLTFAGFGASRFFERTRFPDVPLLLALGLLLGPANRWAVEHGSGWTGLARAFDPASLRTISPYMVAVALVVLLFDSGMQMDFRAFRRSIGPAAVHTIPILALNVIGVSLLGWAVLGMPPLVGAALGVALTNVDQSVSSGILRNLRISDDQRATYFLEMTLYDLISIPILVTLIQVAGGGAGGDVSTGAVLRSLASVTAVSIAVGLAGGISWMYALRALHRHPNSYMLTFSTALATYGLTDLMGGSGALAILLFGLLVGNRTTLLRKFARLRAVDAEHEKVQAFHDEISFFVRTLFFIFLGLSFTWSAANSWPAASPVPGLAALGGTTFFLVAVGLILAVLVLARYVPVRLSALRRPERKALFPVFGRGLDTAVLATLPFLAPAFVQGTPYYETFWRWQPIFVNVALITILLTVLLSSLLVFLHEHRSGKPRRPETPPARPASRAPPAREDPPDAIRIPIPRTKPAPRRR